MESPPPKKQVATSVVVLTLQNPIEVVDDTFVSYTCAFWNVDRSVPDGNVIVIWSPFRTPLVALNVTEYTVRASAPFDGAVLSTDGCETSARGELANPP